MALKLIDAVGRSGLAAKLRPVAMVYARKADEDGKNCFPGVPWVADFLGLKSPIVRRHRDELIAIGVLGFRTVTTKGKRQYREVVAFHADKLPPKVATVVTKVATTVTTLRTEVATTVEKVATVVAPTSISTSKEKSTSQGLASRDNASNDALVSAKGSSRTDPAIRRCISAYQHAYVQRFGTKPLIVGGKDGTLFKKLLAAWGEADVLALIGLFFRTTDPRVQASGFTVGAIFSEGQRLRLQDRHPILRDARTLGNLDAAQRACQPRAAIIEPDPEDP